MRRHVLAPLYVTSAFIVALSSCSSDDMPAVGPEGDGRGKTKVADGGAASTTSPDAGTADGSVGCAPVSTRTHDLDGNGDPDSNLTLAACPTNANDTCLVVSSDLATVNDKAVPLAVGHPPDAMSRIRAIGSHVGGSLSEVSVYAGTWGTAPLRAQLVVVDVEGASVVAKSEVWPGGYYTQFVTELKRPDGTLTPVVTGSATDSSTLAGKMCLFAPSYSQSPCGTGFGVLNGAPSFARNDVTYSTRNNLQGGWAQDIDGDGFEDLATPYYDVAFNNDMSAFYGGFVGISGKTGSTLGMSAVRFASRNPAYASLPASFDSGRFYGVHYAYPPEGGTTSILAVGGLGVGNFKGDASIIMCNVTRYVARLDAPLGNLDAMSFRWGHYFGFYQAVFGGSPASYVVKEPDLLNGCLHRYADSRATSIEGQPIVIYSRFVSDTPVDNCKVEQMAYVNGASVDGYLACVSKNFATTGAWVVEWLDEGNGTKLGTVDNYLWGIASKLLPDQKGSALLVEPIDGKPRFDRTNLVAKPLRVFAASSTGGWHAEPLGTFPVAGPPRVVASTAPPRNVGVVAQPYMELVTRPNCAAPGLVDVAMEAGGWVGYDPVAKAFVAKP